jgi:hypothetical protein
MVRVVGAPTAEVGVVDILVGGLGLTGVLLVCAALLGLGVGGLLIAYKRWRPSNSFNGQTASSRGLNLTPPPPEG